MRRLYVGIAALALALAATAPADAAQAPNHYHLDPGVYRDVQFDGCFLRVMFGTYGDGYAIQGEYVGAPRNSLCGSDTGIKVFTVYPNGSPNRSVYCTNLGRYPPYNIFPYQCVYTPPATTMAHVPGTAIGLRVKLCNANNSQCAEADFDPWGVG